MFILLPREILRIEILPCLDSISLICLQIALYVRPLPGALLDELQEEVISYGLSFTQYFDNLGLLDRDDLSRKAALCGQLVVLQYATEQGYYKGQFVCQWAASGGHLECLKYTHENDYEFFEVAMSAGCEGQLECLKYAMKYEKDDRPYFLEVIAGSGHVPCVDHLVSLGYELNVECLNNAIEMGHLGMVEYLHEHNCPQSDDEITFAAAFGQVAIIKWLHSHNYPWDGHSCIAAARHNNLECLKYLHENGCPWDDECIYRAAIDGAVECLQYTHENGLIINDFWADTIVWRGYIDCLKYFNRQGLMTSTGLDSIAIRMNKLDCLKYLWQEGYPCNLVRRQTSNEDTLTWIREMTELPL